MTSRAELVQKIQTAFNSVKLEEGLDNYADEETMMQLRAKDEKMNWENLSYQELAKCESALAFF